MHIAAILFSLLLTMPGVAAAQEWDVYVNQQDSFTVNFPGQPKIAEITWRSQLGYMLPATRLQRGERAGTLLGDGRGLPAARRTGNRPKQGLPSR